MKILRLAPWLLALAACSQAPTQAPAATPTGTPAESAPVDPVKAMNEAADALMARPEDSVQEITVQHVLIGVKGAPRLNATRSPGEGEALVAELYARALKGEDFGTLVRNYSNDPGEGIYTLSMTRETDGTVFARNDMAKAFGDVGWRLKVGEYGVTRFDGGIPGQEPSSPFGYHLIKRVK